MASSRSGRVAVVGRRQRRRRHDQEFRHDRDDFELSDGLVDPVNATLRLMVSLTAGTHTFLRHRQKVRKNDDRFVERWHRHTLRIACDVMRLLKVSHRHFLVSATTGGQTTMATTGKFAEAAMRAIVYVRAFSNDSLKFVLREMCDYSQSQHIVGGCSRRYRLDRVRMFLLRVNRKCVITVSRLFAEQILRARAPALTSRRQGDDDEIATLRCHVCLRTFEKTFHYLQHIRVHYRLNLYVCRTCTETFVQQNGLDYHSRKCSGRGNEPTENEKEIAMELCEACDRFHRYGTPLRNHVLREHATMNIDLGVNRTQQNRVESILNELKYCTDDDEEK